jgi:NAD(P)-dependent dehydrogenase (short-subunit alcohol dehydrogenase family)
MGVLNGKKAIITGGASGIGRATAILFGEEGASVAILDLDETAGREVASEISNWGARSIYLHCNVARSSDCQVAVNEVSEQFSGVDILVNNAGIMRRANVLDTSVEEWDRVMATNVRSVFLMSKYTIPLMIEAGGGAIVNLGSGWGLSGGKDALAYCASKGAVVNMTRAQAIDHGHQNIRVNSVCPGDTDTSMLRLEALQLGEKEENFLADAADRPLGRLGRPGDIAQAILYLASDASSFVTGTVLVVDGGGLAGG